MTYQPDIQVWFIFPLLFPVSEPTLFLLPPLKLKEVESNKFAFYLNISWETKDVTVVTHFRKLSFGLNISKN